MRVVLELSLKSSLVWASFCCFMPYFVLSLKSPTLGMKFKDIMQLICFCPFKISSSP
jgi:hypothetical protein